MVLPLPGFPLQVDSMRYEVCDVLIVGSGGAALRATIAAKEVLPEGRVMVITKGRMGESGVTAKACSDRMAFHATLPYTEPGGEDNWLYHAEDIYRIGGYVSDWDLAVILARNSGKAIEYLVELGVPFVRREGGRLAQFVTDGSEYARACYTGPYTANHIEEALVRKVRGSGVEVVEGHMVYDLILDKGGRRVVGVYAIDEDEEKELTSRYAIFLAGSVILATGGAGQAFKVSLFPPELTGDGYAAAFRAGAELVNMEFIQIGLSSVKTNLACSGSLMRAVPRFVNDLGEEFLLKYFPDPKVLTNLVFQKGASWPVSAEHPTNAMDILISREIAKGRRVYMDFNANPMGFHFSQLHPRCQQRYQDEIQIPLSGDEARNANPLARLREINPQVIQWFAERGVRLEEGDKVEIAPAIQHFQGGIKIRERGGSTLEGLYAVGEAAGGQHGANRPGGNALMDCQVFGKIAGEDAARSGRRSSISLCRDDALQYGFAVLEGLAKGKGRAAWYVREGIQELMARAAGVIRSEDGLRGAIDELKALEKEGLSAGDGGIVAALETRNIMDVARMILGSAYLRKESRGPHLFFASPDDREPMKRNDPDWRRYIVIRREGGEARFYVRNPITPPSRKEETRKF